MARLSEHGIRLSSMSPSFLNSNSTSHTWPFSAVAELIDNASDPGVSARQIWVDVLEEGEQLCLTFTDNGSGMTPNKLHKMLSFGFTDKGSGKASQQAIGLYGNGFKSGSMRLGRDALVLTKNGGSQSVGMLSQSYLLSIRAQAIIVPIAPFIQHTNSLVVTEDSEASLAAILQHSPISSVEQLHAHFDSIASKKGTKILIWNIRRGKDGKPELDFESDVYDIRLPEVHIDEMKKGLRNPGSQRLEQNLPEMDFSLRAYLSILYLKPRLHIILRGQKVLATLVSKRLTHIEHDVYKPHLSKEKLKVTFGMNPKNKEHFGIMMYHKNRLIKSYEKVGCQIKSSGQRAGVGVIGIIECNFLKPAHNKQDFEYTKEYRLTLGALGLKLNDYWKDMMEKKPKEREFRALNRLDEKKSQDVNKGPMWLQCEECLKWRSLPGQHYKDPPDNWNCSQNPNPRFRSCSVSEEEDCEEIPSPSYHQTHTKQNKSKCRKRETSLEVCSLQDQREKHQALSRCVSEPSPCTIQHHDDTAGRTHPQHAADATRSHGETHTHVLPDDEMHTGDGTHTQVLRAEEEVPHAEEDVPRAEEDVPRAEEEVPRAEEDVPRDEEDVPRDEEDVPRDEEDVPRAEEDVPRKVSRTDENVARTENTEQNGRGADTGKEHLTHNHQDKPTKKEDTMQAQEATSTSIQSGPSTVERLSLKRNIEWPHGSLKKRLCLWKDQQPSPEDMAHAMHPGKEANKAQMMSVEKHRQDNPSLGRNPTSLSTQTVKVSPLSRTEGGQNRSYSREGVDRESLLQRLSGLEKETQKIQKLLGLELKRTTQGTMTTDCVSAQKPLVEMETQTAAVETSVSTCQTENEALDQDRAKKDKNETPSIHVDTSAAAQEDLRVLRKNVVALLSVLLPQLDLTGISLDTPDVDTIMQQIIHVNSLTS